jgi:putative transposase
MRPGLIPGDVLCETPSGQERYRITDYLSSIASFKAIDLLERGEVMLDHDDVRAKVSCGKLRVLRQGEAVSGVRTARTPNEDATTQATLHMLEQLEAIQLYRGTTLRQAFAELQEKHQAGQLAQVQTLPSLSHMYRLMERRRTGLPLHLGHAAKGNRQPKHSEAVRALVCHCAELYLQSDSRWTLRKLTQYINQQLHDSKPADPHDAANLKVSRGYVQRVIAQDLHADASHARMNPHDAIAAKAVASRRIRVEGLFERVEQDALHIPAQIETPYGTSREIWLVHAIECSCSIPIGWHLQIGAPRTSSTMACIESILFPKAPRLKALGLAYDFDIYGTPQQLVLDNGPENKSDKLVRLSHIGIDVQRLKARHPQNKPFIERMNRSLKEYLETLPGSTRMDGKDGQRDPSACGDAVMHIEELEQWIARFFFEHWMNKPLLRLQSAVFTDAEHMGNTPLQRYQHLTKAALRPMPLPTSIDTWRSVVFSRHELRLSLKTGISYDTFQFGGNNLHSLIGKFGNSQVTVLVDDEDFRMVYVLDADQQTLIELVNKDVDSSTPAYSFTEAKRLRKESAVVAQDSAVQRDLFNRSAGITAPNSQSSARKAQNKSMSSKETSAKARAHGAVMKTVSKPLPAPMPTLGQPLLSAEQDAWAVVEPLAVMTRKPSQEGA